MNKFLMFLQLFAEGETAAAPAGGGAETAAAEISAPADVPFKVGDTMADGTSVANAKVAAALNRQMKRHPELRQAYAQGQQPQQQAPAQVPQGQPVQTPEPAEGQEVDLEAEFNELIHGKYKDVYGNRVRNAVNDRFKNQADARAEMDGWRPVIEALMKKSGAADEAEFRDLVLNDDSLLEEEAEERGMSTEALRTVKAMEAENARYKAAMEAQQQKQQLDNLMAQEAELQKVYPEFSLINEMQDPEFRRAIANGMTVERAFYAMHGKDLQTQAMAYGMNRTREQLGQTIQAQRARPGEGAMNGRSQAAAAEPRLNPANMTKAERKKLKDYVKSHGAVSFD